MFTFKKSLYTIKSKQYTKENKKKGAYKTYENINVNVGISTKNSGRNS